ncbi:Lin0512 family protein [Geomonas sp. RF6]|uniref:Lin0512 family protein n=1 Tax=Geomonas sp. RF6 TaxID=2897342 RepID=UPI001E457A57|nr:Lin0512 family protein [Geomonas sp. RF6]UFS70675.1 Lin0512 family protein [Geomonas sp. RF6]
MAKKRFIVELGYGADLHGGDVTKAAQRAVRDAVSRNCLCGLIDIIGIDDPHKMHVAVKIGCPKPDQVDAAKVLEVLPFGSREIEIVAGGLSVRGLELPQLGAGDQICVAVAALTVSVDVE